MLSLEDDMSTHDANFVPLNDADNWLHLLLAVGMLALGLVLPPRRKRRTTTADAAPS